MTRAGGTSSGSPGAAGGPRRVVLIGPVQARVIIRATTSGYQFVMPRDFLERRALRRLAARNLARQVVGQGDLWEVDCGRVLAQSLQR